MKEDAADWVAAEGVVTSCRFQFARLNPLALGFQTADRFRITFDYRAQGRLYSDEFGSPIAIPQDERVALRYDPEHPERNSRSATGAAGSTRSPRIAVGVVGSVILSLLWLAMLRGC
jgi:hypothetical protein